MGQWTNSNIRHTVTDKQFLRANMSKCTFNPKKKNHTGYRRIDDKVNKGEAWKTPFAFADCVFDQRFIYQQWWAQEKLRILFAAIRY